MSLDIETLSNSLNALVKDFSGLKSIVMSSLVSKVSKCEKRLEEIESKCIKQEQVVISSKSEQEVSEPNTSSVIIDDKDLYYAISAKITESMGKKIDQAVSYSTTVKTICFNHCDSNTKSCENTIREKADEIGTEVSNLNDSLNIAEININKLLNDSKQISNLFENLKSKFEEQAFQVDEMSEKIKGFISKKTVEEGFDLIKADMHQSVMKEIEQSRGSITEQIGAIIENAKAEWKELISSTKFHGDSASDTKACDLDERINQLSRIVKTVDEAGELQNSELSRINDQIRAINEKFQGYLQKSEFRLSHDDLKIQISSQNLTLKELKEGIAKIKDESKNCIEKIATYRVEVQEDITKSENNSLEKVEQIREDLNSSIITSTNYYNTISTQILQMKDDLKSHQASLEDLGSLLQQKAEVDKAEIIKNTTRFEDLSNSTIESMKLNNVAIQSIEQAFESRLSKLNLSKVDTSNFNDCLISFKSEYEAYIKDSISKCNEKISTLTSVSSEKLKEDIILRMSNSEASVKLELNQIIEKVEFKTQKALNFEVNKLENSIKSCLEDSSPLKSQLETVSQLAHSHSLQIEMLVSTIDHCKKESFEYSNLIKKELTESIEKEIYDSQMAILNGNEKQNSEYESKLTDLEAKLHGLSGEVNSKYDSLFKLQSEELAAANEKLSGFNKRLDGFDIDLDNIEKSFGDNLDLIQSKFHSHIQEALMSTKTDADARLVSYCTDLEARLINKLEEQSEELHSNIEDLESKFEKFKIKVHEDIYSKLSSELELKIGDINKRIEELIVFVSDSQLEIHTKSSQMANEIGSNVEAKMQKMAVDSSKEQLNSLSSLRQELESKFKAEQTNLQEKILNGMALVNNELLVKLEEYVSSYISSSISIFTSKVKKSIISSFKLIVAKLIKCEELITINSVVDISNYHAFDILSEMHEESKALQNQQQSKDFTNKFMPIREVLGFTVPKIAERLKILEDSAKEISTKTLKSDLCYKEKFELIESRILPIESEASKFAQAITETRLDLNEITQRNITSENSFESLSKICESIRSEVGNAKLAIANIKKETNLELEEKLKKLKEGLVSSSELNKMVLDLTQSKLGLESALSRISELANLTQGFEKRIDLISGNVQSLWDTIAISDIWTDKKVKK